MTKRLSCFLSLAAGIGLGWGVPRALEEKPVPKPHPKTPFNDSFRAMWLFNNEASLDSMFEEAGLAEALRHPGKIEIHRIGGDGKLEIRGRKYNSKARTPSPEIQQELCGALISLNAYRPASACGFNPAILLRLTGGDQTYDMEFCFSCHDIRYADESAVGMSDEGWAEFIRCFSETFPEFAELKEMRMGGPEHHR